MNKGTIIAVTGATGFIGRKFVLEAARRGFVVRALIRNADTHLPGASHVHPFDLSTQDRLCESTLADCTAIVHFASRIPPDQSNLAEARACWETNALGSLKLMEAAASANVRHFVQSVSANAYNSDQQSSGEMPSADENTQMYPSKRATFYLTSKLAQELYTAFVAQTSNMTVSTLRLSSVYGPGQIDGLLPTLVSRLLNNQSVQLVNEGKFGADFVYIDDVIEAAFLALQNAVDGPINVGSGHRHTIKQITEALLRLTSASDSLVEYTNASSCDHGFPALNISKARKLGFRPTELEHGLAELVENVKRRTRGVV